MTSTSQQSHHKLIPKLPTNSLLVTKNLPSGALFTMLIMGKSYFLQNFRSKNNPLKEIFCLISSIVIQAWHSKLKLLHYLTKFYVFHKRKFPKLMSEMQVSFMNEAPGPKLNMCHTVETSNR
jgi:hypothetical protein